MQYNPFKIDSGYAAPALKDVLLEHLEEYAFLSMQRRKLIFDPGLPMCHFMPHIARMEAHWDGLAIGRPVSADIAREQIEEAFDPWDLYAAVKVWLALGDPTVDVIVEKLSEADAEVLPSYREAFRRLSRERLVHLFPDGVFTSDAGVVKSMLTFALGWRGLLGKSEFISLAASADPAVRLSLARSLGWVKERNQIPTDVLDALQEDSDAQVRRAALWSLALINPDEAAAICRSNIQAGNLDPFDPRVLGLTGNLEDMPLLADLTGAGGTGIAAIHALGDLGNIEIMWKLIELTRHKDVPVVLAAVDAIKKLIGDIDFVGEADPDEGGTDNADVALAPPSDLPPPEILKQHWEVVRKKYPLDEQWLRSRRLPWKGPLQEAPMEALWHMSLKTPAMETNWLRKEVPDGFFTAAEESDAIVGV